MRIKSIKLYQAVTFEKKSELHFSSFPIIYKPQVSLKAVLIEGVIPGIEISSEKDLIYVPASNVASIYPWTENDDVHLEEFKKNNEYKPYTPSHLLRKKKQNAIID